MIEAKIERVFAEVGGMWLIEGAVKQDDSDWTHLQVRLCSDVASKQADPAAFIRHCLEMTSRSFDRTTAMRLIELEDDGPPPRRPENEKTMEEFNVLVAKARADGLIDD